MVDRNLSPTKTTYIKRYDSVINVFESVFREIKDLAKKKPDATLSVAKCKLINRILDDVRAVVAEEPEIRYLEPLDEESLPQYSDAVLVMAQHDAALAAFRDRHYGFHYDEEQWVHEGNWDSDADDSDQEVP